MRSRSRRAILQTGEAVLPEPGDPAMRALPGDAEFFGDMRDRAPGQDTLDKDQTAGNSQPRVTVDHEKAFSRVTLDTTHAEGLFPIPASPTL
jgi:hypothetical protein